MPSALDECNRIAFCHILLAAPYRLLLMTGSLHLNTSKVAFLRCHALLRPPARCAVHQYKPIACAARLHLTSTGSSGSSSDGSDTSTNALRKGPGSLRKKDFRKFVHFFRQASPYIEGHRDKTFVIVIPGEVGYPQSGPLIELTEAPLGRYRV